MPPRPGNGAASGDRGRTIGRTDTADFVHRRIKCYRFFHLYGFRFNRVPLNKVALLSLSLSLYIYIYTYTCVAQYIHLDRGPGGGGTWVQTMRPFFCAGGDLIFFFSTDRRF